MYEKQQIRCNADLAESTKLASWPLKCKVMTSIDDKILSNILGETQHNLIYRLIHSRFTYTIQVHTTNVDWEDQSSK